MAVQLPPELEAAASKVIPLPQEGESAGVKLPPELEQAAKVKMDTYERPVNTAPVNIPASAFAQPESTNPAEIRLPPELERAARTDAVAAGFADKSQPLEAFAPGYSETPDLTGGLAKAFTDSTGDFISRYLFNMQRRLGDIPSEMKGWLGRELQLAGTPGGDTGRVLAQRMLENFDLHGPSEQTLWGKELTEQEREQLHNLGVGALLRKGAEVLTEPFPGVPGHGKTIAERVQPLIDAANAEYGSRQQVMEDALGKPQGFAQELADIAGGSSAFNIASALAAGAINPQAGLSTMWFLSGAQQEAERAYLGDAPDVAKASGRIEGWAETGGEVLPFAYLGGKIAAKTAFGEGSSLLKTAGEYIAREIPGELVSQAVEDFRDRLIHNPNEPAELFWKNFWHNQMMTIPATVIGGGVDTAIMTGAAQAKDTTIEGVKSIIRKGTEAYIQRANERNGDVAGAYTPLSDEAQRVNEAIRVAKELEAQILQAKTEYESRMLARANALPGKTEASSIENDIYGMYPAGTPQEAAFLDETEIAEPGGTPTPIRQMQLDPGKVYLGHSPALQNLSALTTQLQLKADLERAQGGVSKQTQWELDSLKEQRNRYTSYLTELQSIAETMMKEAGFTDYTLVLQPYGEERGSFWYGKKTAPSESNYGHIALFGNTFQLAINMQALRPDVQLGKGGAKRRFARNMEIQRASTLETLAHEIGHGIMMAHWNAMSPAEKDAFRGAYREMIAKVQRRNEYKHLHTLFNTPATFNHQNMGFLRSVSSPQTMQSGLRTKGVPSQGHATPTDVSSALGTNRRYFDLQEFLANQSAKFFGRKYSQEVLPAIGPMAKALRNYWKKVAKKWNATETFSDFMQRIALDRQLDDTRQRLYNLVQDRARIFAEFAKNPPAVVVHKNTSKLYNAMEKVHEVVAPGAAHTPSPVFGQTVQDVDRFNWFIKQTAGLLNLRDLNPHVPGFTLRTLAAPETYVEATERLWQIKSQWTERALEITRLWIDQVQKLGDAETQMEALDNVLFEADRLSGELDRALTDPELEILRQQFGLKVEHLDIARKIWNLFREAATAVEGIRIREINAKRASVANPNGLSDVEANRQIADVQKSFAKMRNRNYMPHQRFGRYIVRVRALSPVTYQGKSFSIGQMITSSHFENEGHAKKAAEILRKNWQAGQVKVEEDVLSDFESSLSGFDPILLEAVLSGLNLTPDQRQELQEKLIKLTPAASFAKQFLRRKNIPGYSEHATRVFSNYFSRFANHIARMETRPAMEAAIAEMEDSKKALVNQKKRSQLIDWVKEHKEYLLNPGNELANLRAIGSMFYLALVPKSALVNTIQIATNLYPHLAAKYNDVDAVATLMKVMKDLFLELRTGNQLVQEEADLFKWLQDIGKLDQSLAVELAALSEGNFFNRGVSWFWETSDASKLKLFKAQEYAMMMFQAMEKLNRRVAALASYRLAIKNGASIDEAYNEAKLSIDRTMYEYNRYDRARLMRGKKSAFLLFQTFVLKTLYFIGTDPGRWRYLLMMLFLAGYQSLPFMENALDFIDFALTKFGEKAGWDNPKSDVRLEVRRYMDSMNEATHGWWFTGDTVAHGLTRHLGWGSSFGPFDISSSIGMGRILPWTQYLNGQMTPEEIITESMKDQAGALIGIPMNVLAALGSDDPSVWKRVEMTLPNAAKNLSKAMRWGLQGYETDPSGAIIADFSSPRGRIEAAMQGLGFAPTRLNQLREAKWEANSSVMYWQARRSILMEAHFNALAAEDDELRSEVIDRIVTYNETVPDRDMRITREDLRNSAKRRSRERARKEAGVYRTKRYSRYYDEVMQDYLGGTPQEELQNPGGTQEQ